MKDLHVIVPTFNNEDTVGCAVDSLLQQSYDNIQIWVINDGSTDKTQEILTRYEHEQKVQIINTDNGGAGRARNIGIESALAQNAKYIGFCDADDSVAPTKFETQINFLNENCEVGYSVTSEHQFSADESINKESFDKSNSCDSLIDDMFDCLCMRNFPFHPATSLFRASLLKQDVRFSEFKCGEDFKMHLLLALRGTKIHKINQPLYFTRIRPDSLQRHSSAPYFDGLARSTAISEILHEYAGLLSQEQIKTLLIARDRFFQWHLSGGRKISTYKESLKRMNSVFNEFYSKRKAIYELVKTIINK